MPLPIVSVMAGRPAFVAGILMSTFSRSTIRYSSSASVAVAAVSFASVGATSIETRPS